MTNQHDIDYALMGEDADTRRHADRTGLRGWIGGA
ncbi:MAG: hypothetical protein QOI64_1634 [Solirubrobacteraceae bacterium]|jgi:hypothetical protein|nr:hypothetical protein [Solirubrobacteraceae bacterium]